MNTVNPRVALATCGAYPDLFEPLMFLAGHPEAPGRFARAVHGRLLAHQGF